MRSKLYAIADWLMATMLDGLFRVQEWFDHQNGICSTCGHAEHYPGKCAGDPLDVADSGIGGNTPHEAQGCLCGDPEFAR